MTARPRAGMSDGFDGFPKEGLAFLRKLGTRDKKWFDANRKTYDATVVAPTKAFVVAVGERLDRGIAPGIVAQPKANGSIAPINNDLRFSPDKSPYKDHLLLRFWQGKDKKTAPTLEIPIVASQPNSSSSSGHSATTPATSVPMLATAAPAIAAAP